MSLGCLNCSDSAVPETAEDKNFNGSVMRTPQKLMQNSISEKKTYQACPNSEKEKRKEDASLLHLVAVVQKGNSIFYAKFRHWKQTN